MRRVNISYRPVLCSLALVALFGCNRASTKITAPSVKAAGVDQTVPALSFTPLVEGIESAKLPVRKPVEGRRFRSMSVEQTGLDFAHNWSPPPGYRLEIYNSLPGGGVCVGDFDADGWPDVFLSQPYVGSRLYRNLGNWRFQDVTHSTIGDVPRAFGASFVDIDNDGDLDLYICNDEQPNNLFINDGQGRFAERAQDFCLDFNGASVMMAFADFDRDGDLDGYLVTNRKEPASGSTSSSEQTASSPEFTDVIISRDGKSRVIKAAQYDHLFRNNGDGTFTDVSQTAGITGNYWGLAATWWDYDRDGWPDLYVSNDFYSPDQLYRNNGDGTFTDVAPDALPHTPWYSMGSDVADINNDGWLDLMGSDMSGTSHYKQKASMGDMSTTGWFLTHPTPRQYMRNALYLNTGTSRFMEIAQLAGLANTDWTWSLKFADLDEDGWTDLFVTNGMNRDWTNSDLRNKSNQAASPEEKMQIWLESPQRRDPNMVFRNGGDLRFKELGASWGLSGQHVSYGAALADLDRDGDLDLIVNHAEEAVGVYQNQTAETRRVLLQLVGDQSNRWGVGATVVATTADGKRLTRYLNTSQGFMASNEPLMHFGLGESDRLNLQVTWPSGHRQVFRDLPADRYYMIHESAATEPVSDNTPPEPLFAELPILEQFAHRETPFNDYARQPLLPYQLSQLGPAVTTGDVDRDGNVDIVVGGASGQPTQLLINNGGSFRLLETRSFSSDADFEDMGLLLFDADEDNDLDLYVVSGGVEAEAHDPVLQDRLYYNDGHGVFSRTDDRAVPSIDHSGSVVCGNDFDRDGDMDLFVGGRVIPGQYPLTPSSYLLQNSDGEFVDATDELSEGLRNAGLVTDAVWADADGDGWTDLLLTTEWGPVRLFRNERGRLVDNTAAAQLSSRLGWWSSIAASDLDADGDVDFVVGNVGWNTKYHASEQQPTLLYYGDFERTGRMRLVEAEYEDEKLFPVRGKSCSTNAMPFLGQKFGKFHDFAVASLDEIYTSACLDNSYRYAANTLESGVLINDGRGQFVFASLPTLAQVSPARAILVGHFNDDEHLDIFLAQNFFGPQPETGRFDGGVGLVLAGLGDGTFRALMPRESGIVVPGDASAAVLADLDQDGRAEIIVTTNDGPIYTFDRTSP